MKFCEAITFEPTGGGAGVIFQGKEWPAEIVVERGLLEYPQGPHIQFGRRGSLAFVARNGSASYRRVEDVINGWRYVRTDAVLQNGAVELGRARPAAQMPPVPAKRYRVTKTGAAVEAFQWLPHAVPALPIPDWFMRADFEQNKDGILTVRSKSGVARAEPSDWIILVDGKIVSVTSAAFAQGYEAEDTAAAVAA